MLNYKQLHYFWRVAKVGSIARAAEQLCLAPQTISSQIGTLEESLGTELFHRVGRRLELTAAGQLAVSYADDIFRISRELEVNPVEEIMRLTDGRGVDVAIEALGRQETLEAALRVLRPGGTLSSLGVYSSDLKIPIGPFLAGLGDHTIVTTLCPGGKERMRRLMDVIATKRLDTRQLVTHRFRLDQIEEAYDLFANQRDGVLKVAILP